MAGAADIVLSIEDVVQRFGPKLALSGVSLRVERGKIHALLGPNGAGKTTTLRIVAGLLAPTEGTLRILGREGSALGRGRRGVSLIPSGDRTFYLRLSGLENLAFFGRLHGLTRRQAIERAEELLAELGLADAARRPVGLYSHGMQKRLSAARALITGSALLLVDEATHDLDPEGARRVRGLIGELAARGTAVVWATQRLDEIRGFADRVTVLNEGCDVFTGTVPELLARTVPRSFLLRLRNGDVPRALLVPTLQSALGSAGTITGVGGEDSESYLLRLEGDAILGDALAGLSAAPVELLACREEHSAIEEAFLSLTGSPPGDEA